MHGLETFPSARCPSFARAPGTLAGAALTGGAILTTLVSAATNVGASPAAAASAYVRVVGIAPGRSLWVRSGPGMSFKRIGFLPHDARFIRSYGCQRSANGNWCNIRYRNARGWAARRYLAPDTAPRT